jgi:hypothetical protein
MITSQQIAKEIDLKRFLSIVEDLPKIEKRTAYNFDLPITVLVYLSGVDLKALTCRTTSNYIKRTALGLNG